MVKRIISCVVALFPCWGLQAQVIEGTVFDAKTREAIAGVVIYFDGTSIVTTSDIDGKFRLATDNIIHANLVFNHLSYEPCTIERPYEHREKAFYLKEKVNTLAEVKVVADKYTRAEKIKVFKEQFLGKTVAGKSCVILNEDDILLHYDRETDMLIGRADKPIVIENRYLAYRITFDLHNFSVQYLRSENTLDMAKITRVAFKGTSSFIDQSPYNILFAKRREEIYVRSSQCFWKNLANHTLNDAKFRIFNKYRRIDPDQYFLISNAPSQKAVLIIPGTDLNLKHIDVQEEPVYGVIGIAYDGKFRSEVVVLSNRFFLDEYGNPDSIDNLVYFGDMGEQRLGDMLPRDFIYTILDK